MKFFIITLPRSGSTMFRHVLSKVLDNGRLLQKYDGELGAAKGFQIAESLGLSELILRRDRVLLQHCVDRSIYPFAAYRAMQDGDHIKSMYSNFPDPGSDEFAAMDLTGMNFIHLIRRNNFRQAVSLLAASQSQLWHLAKGEQAAMEDFEFPREKVLNRIYQFVYGKYAWIEKLQTANKVVTLYYEDIIQNPWPPHVQAKLEAFFGRAVSNESVPCPWEPTAASRNIVNYDQLSDLDVDWPFNV